MLAAGAIVVSVIWFNLPRDRSEEKEKDALTRIHERGYMIALTDENTMNYFISRGEPMGFQLSLLESFARELGVPLRVIASNDYSKLDYYIRNNAADLMALDLPITSYNSDLISYSLPLGETRLVLVQKKNKSNTDPAGSLVTSLKKFPEDTVYVQLNPFQRGFYHQFYKATGKKAILKEVAGVSQEKLVRMVAEGTIRFAVVHENVAMELKRYFYNLDLSVVVYPLFSYGWGFRSHSDSLGSALDIWIKELKASGKLKKIYLEYFNNQRIAGLMQSDYFSPNGKKLSPYDDEIKKSSRIINWDWRLVASLVYQESNFRQGQISTHNASGLMQLMPEISSRFGIDSLSTPSRQIEGGVRYLKYLDKQFPEEITNPLERINFVLAAYNVGIGRVLAAREKAEQFGRDKNRWNRHVDYYLLRRSKKDPRGHADTSATSPVDYKTEGFVDDIVSRYFHYRNLYKQP